MGIFNWLPRRVAETKEEKSFISGLKLINDEDFINKIKSIVEIIDINKLKEIIDKKEVTITIKVKDV